MTETGGSSVTTEEIMASPDEDRRNSLKPSVLILGGCGFIGRNFVHHLVSNNLATKIRVADKTPPQTAWLNKLHKESFAKVEFVSANLINTGSVSKVFDDNGSSFDVVVNLAAQTKYGCTDEVYKEGVLTLSLHCAKEAARRNAKKYIEVSTGQVYTADKKASHEDSKTSPWTGIAKYKLQIEEELPRIEGLNYMIIRPAIVYGIGDRTGVMPRLITAAVYRQLQEKMKLLWTPELKMNTIHVEDLCLAVWHLIQYGQQGHVYNIVDKSDTTQGSMAELVCRIFDIKHDYFGTVISNFARLNMAEIVDDSNDKHFEPWTEACNRDGLQYTPLSPYLHQELLYNKHLYMDGQKLETTGFQLTKPQLTEELLRQMLDDYVSMGLFPKSLAPSLR
ncbi:4-hydroxy-2-methyl-3-oxo-4-farnesyl-3,4-dihydroquinoline-1-oxide ketoreductase-like [Asterias amurensis]|uniref:4-hydroxy-2-methyl-3-oxo-4-farnesyl-3, 4-dihydroquinoline-1-oxide ketoreductase-like n=1 Tax=Asterias amurensis TaxID=7602 RepID=UPI003AB70422